MTQEILRRAKLRIRISKILILWLIHAFAVTLYFFIIDCKARNLCKVSGDMLGCVSFTVTEDSVGNTLVGCRRSNGLLFANQDVSWQGTFSFTAVSVLIYKAKFILRIAKIIKKKVFITWHMTQAFSVVMSEVSNKH